MLTILGSLLLFLGQAALGFEEELPRIHLSSLCPPAHEILVEELARQGSARVHLSTSLLELVREKMAAVPTTGSGLIALLQSIHVSLSLRAMIRVTLPKVEVHLQDSEVSLEHTLPPWAEAHYAPAVRKNFSVVNDPQFQPSADAKISYPKPGKIAKVYVLNGTDLVIPQFVHELVHVYVEEYFDKNISKLVILYPDYIWKTAKGYSISEQFFYFVSEVVAFRIQSELSVLISEGKIRPLSPGGYWFNFMPTPLEVKANKMSKEQFNKVLDGNIYKLYEFSDPRLLPLIGKPVQELLPGII